jgi:uncharacterized protein (TIRG00374 family)
MTVGIIISLAALAVLLWLVDARQVLENLETLRVGIILVVLALLALSLLTRAAAWRTILKNRISLGRSYLIINSGYFVNTVLPFRIGEITRAFLLLPSGFGFWEALPTIVLERLFDFGFVLVIFFLTLPYAVNFSQGISLVYILAGLVLLGFLILFLLVRNNERVMAWIKRLPLLGEQSRSRLMGLFQSVLESLKVLNDPASLGKVFTYMLLSWGIALLIQFILLRAFLPEAKLVWAAFALSALSLGVSIPSSPGNIGIYEGSITLALSAFGIDQSVAFAYALVSHLLSLFVTTLLGSYGLVREGYALGDVWRFSKQHREEKVL